MPNWALLLVRFALSAAFCALATWIGWKTGEKAWALTFFVFSVPVIGVAIAKPLVELSHEGFSWLAGAHSREWHGAYYEFNGVQVRVYEDDERLWFAAADVLKACGMKAIVETMLAIYPTNCARIGRIVCLDLEGVEKLFADNPKTELGRLTVWAKREVVTPWERKRSGALVSR